MPLNYADLLIVRTRLSDVRVHARNKNNTIDEFAKCIINTYSTCTHVTHYMKES